MKILLTQNEIEQAVREFVSKGVSLSNGAEMSIEFSMGRGDNGLTASIDVPYMNVASLPVTPAPMPSLVSAATTANVAGPKTVDVVVQPDVATAFSEPAATTAGSSLFGTAAAATPATGTNEA